MIFTIKMHWKLFYYKNELEIIFTIKMHNNNNNNFYYENTLEMIFYYENALEMIFTIKMN